MKYTRKSIIQAVFGDSKTVMESPNVKRAVNLAIEGKVKGKSRVELNKDEFEHVKVMAELNFKKLSIYNSTKANVGINAMRNILTGDDL